MRAAKRLGGGAAGKSKKAKRGSLCLICGCHGQATLCKDDKTSASDRSKFYAIPIANSRVVPMNAAITR